MRFGKRFANDVDLIELEQRQAPGVMRFGKRSPAPGIPRFG